MIAITPTPGGAFVVQIRTSAIVVAATITADEVRELARLASAAIDSTTPDTSDTKSTTKEETP